VSHKLLAKVDFVLFLNKIDLLQACHTSLSLFLQTPLTLSILATFQAKLDTGVRLNHYMPYYGDRPNDYDSVSKCEFPTWRRRLRVILTKSLGTPLIRLPNQIFERSQQLHAQ
jgi:guanine nucleotide-binding protein subunit alpha